MRIDWVARAGLELHTHIKSISLQESCPQPSSEAPDQLIMDRESRTMQTKKQEGVIALRAHGIVLPTSE